MASIRLLEPADLGSVEKLLELHMPGWGSNHEVIRRAFDDPWAEPGIGPLVAMDDDGNVVGFLGAAVRRIRFDDSELRGVCASHLVVAPDQRAGAVGALLLGRLIKGDQDLTWSDTATDIVARIWQAYGGQVDHTRSLDWRFILRPGKWLRHRAVTLVNRRLRRHSDEGFGAPAASSEQSSTGVAGLSHMATVASKPSVAAGASAATAVEAESGDVAEHLAQLSARLRLHVAYDADQLGYVFRAVTESEGELSAQVVEHGGTPVGWYAYLPRPTGVSRVLHVALRSPQDADFVMGELRRDADRRGCSVLNGRLEPHLSDYLRRHRALVGFARRPVFHARDDRLRAVLGTGGALLTRLDGEWFSP